MTIIEENMALVKMINDDMKQKLALERALCRLVIATDRLDEIFKQAEAQFNAGDRHATFSKQTIESLKMGLLGDVDRARKILNRQK